MCTLRLLSFGLYSQLDQVQNHSLQVINLCTVAAA
jgi:hypothetical protein